MMPILSFLYHQMPFLQPFSHHRPELPFPGIASFTHPLEFQLPPSFVYIHFNYEFPNLF
jgi:hypothetical protein